MRRKLLKRLWAWGAIGCASFAGIAYLVSHLTTTESVWAIVWILVIVAFVAVALIAALLLRKGGLIWGITFHRLAVWGSLTGAAALICVDMGSYWEQAAIGFRHAEVHFNRGYICCSWLQYGSPLAMPQIMVASQDDLLRPYDFQGGFGIHWQTSLDDVPGTVGVELAIDHHVEIAMLYPVMVLVAIGIRAWWRLRRTIVGARGFPVGSSTQREHARA